jgi:hypothetical protein
MDVEEDPALAVPLLHEPTIARQFEAARHVAASAGDVPP